MLAILGEDRSDVETLKVIVKRWLNNDKLPIKHRGFKGSGRLITRGAEELKLLRKVGASAFIICHDADGPNGDVVHRKIQEQVVNPSGLDKARCCIVVPVHELEAWILADVESMAKIMKSWKPKPVAYPENVPNPKESLEKLSYDKKSKPRYVHSTDNPRVAEHLDLEKVKKKCKSFRPLSDFLDAHRKAFAR